MNPNRILGGLLSLLLALWPVLLQAQLGYELVQNPGAENLSSEGRPLHWQQALADHVCAYGVCPQEFEDDDFDLRGFGEYYFRLKGQGSEVQLCQAWIDLKDIRKHIDSARVVCELRAFVSGMKGNGLARLEVEWADSTKQPLGRTATDAISFQVLDAQTTEISALFEAKGRARPPVGSRWMKVCLIGGPTLEPNYAWRAVADLLSVRLALTAKP